ncbi:MAG: hypothetical protein U5K37_07555 [Natrialbaceae archaeon]|nr:hypothetical protein [Natrialbaceae archaeon]
MGGRAVAWGCDPRVGRRTRDNGPFSRRVDRATGRERPRRRRRRRAACATAIEAGAATVLPAGLEAPIGVDRDAIGAALEVTLADGAARRTAPLLSAPPAEFHVGQSSRRLGDRGDSRLILRFSIHADGTELEVIRADGLTVARHWGAGARPQPPAGARLEPGAGSLAIVPVADFSLDRHDWVVSQDRPFELRIERDEVPVTLRADGRAVADLDEGDAITIEGSDSISLLEP